MKLKYLLKDLPVTVEGSKEVEITGITANSKQIAPGNLFLAKKGLTHDGAQFIPDAIAAGAVAVVTDIYNPFFNCVQVIPNMIENLDLGPSQSPGAGQSQLARISNTGDVEIVPAARAFASARNQVFNQFRYISSDIQNLEAVLANRFYDYPGEKLFLVGITGTNGKTTTSYLVKHLLDREKEFCGLIGTIEWIVGEKILPSTHTTPDVITLTKLFHDMTAHGCQSAVMEVSSHALSQGRVQGVPFDVAVFTNLTLEHLDYHGTMENYAAAKAQLFSMLPEDGYAIYNTDDPWHLQMIRGCCAQKLSYGFSDGADLRASHLILNAEGMSFSVAYRGHTMAVSSPLIGRFNVYNILAAMGVGIARHLPLEAVIENLKSFKRVPGRLERVSNRRGLNVFVDYAHTDDALRNVLETLQEFKTGKIITVFGCGGNRDTSKRPKMASVAEAFSDFVIVTTDNPRQEDPKEIVRQILPGFTQQAQFAVTLDRREAIHQAIGMANREDIVLIAGKGHETYQIFSHQTEPFDDREVARQAAIC